MKTTEKENGFVLKNCYGSNDRRRIYHAITPTGENIAVEISDCETGFKYRKDFGWFWRFNKQIKTKKGATKYNYKNVQTYCEREKDFVCMSLYNVSVKKDGTISHKYDHATDQTILEAIWKKATENKENINEINFNDFDNLEGLTDRGYKALFEKAKKAYQKTQYRYKRFEDQACFISSSSLHGFYFPNLGAGLRCIAFRNCKPVLIFDK